VSRVESINEWVGEVYPITTDTHQYVTPFGLSHNCDNTMKAGLSEKGPEARVKHTRNSLDKLDAMRAKLELEFIADEVSEEFNRLCETKVTGLQFKQFLTEYRLDKDGTTLLTKAW